MGAALDEGNGGPYRENQKLEDTIRFQFTVHMKSGASFAYVRSGIKASAASNFEREELHNLRPVTMNPQQRQIYINTSMEEKKQIEYVLLTEIERVTVVKTNERMECERHAAETEARRQRGERFER
jgi:hypothetical protein